MLEAWKSIIAARRQYDCWDLSQPLDKSVVEEIIEEMNTQCAKKQNKPHIALKILDWSDPKLRGAIYDYTRNAESDDRTRENFIAINPQMLAHYLIVFVNVKEHTRLGFLGNISTGLHANYITHSAAARGLRTGFCQCSDRDLCTDEQYEYMLDCLGIENFDQVYLMMGLGHGLKENSMINPATGETVECWSRIGKGEQETNPLPAVSDYVEFL